MRQNAKLRVQGAKRELKVLMVSTMRMILMITMRLMMVKEEEERKA